MAEGNTTDLKKVNTDWSELERKIHEHRKKRFRRILTVIIICAALFVAWIIFRMFMQYHEYQVLSTQERVDTEGTSFAELNGYVIRYNNEGVSCSDIDGKTLWSQPYEMNEPMMSRKGDYMAFADRLGKTVYIVNENGLAGQLSTDYGIRGVDVAANGAAAVLMQEGDTAYMGLYSLNGTKIAEGAIHFGGARNNANGTLTDLLADGTTRNQNVRFFFQDEALNGFGTFLAALYRLGTRLKNVNLAVGAVFTPFDIHGTPVMLFDNDRKAGKLKNVVIR